MFCSINPFKGKLLNSKIQIQFQDQTISAKAEINWKRLMGLRRFSKNLFSCNFPAMLRILRRKLWRLCSRLRWIILRRPKVIIRRLNSKGQPRQRKSGSQSAAAYQNGQGNVATALPQKPIRVATFNVALFSLAPAVPEAEKSDNLVHEGDNCFKNVSDNPKSILKQSPLHPHVDNTSPGQENLLEQTKSAKSKPKVSINLPDNEISLANNKLLSIVEQSSGKLRSLGPVRSPICFPASMTDNWMIDRSFYGSRTILDVLREVDADILALQDVKADEEKNMKPLSDLAQALGMNYVFADSWAPEYGNAILSKWPIKKWKVHKIFDDQDFRNVLKATIDVPWAGEMNFHCTQLDHLDENWRLKQINAIIQVNDHPHVLAGGLNSLDGSDYSLDRWLSIVKYFEEIGKPTQKVEVMNFLKGKGYIDAKDSAGECEPVVIIAKGQNVQGTCKYGTRVDYILASPNMPYKFVPGSYSVISSKGTSDHHIVKVEIMRDNPRNSNTNRRHKKLKPRFARITCCCSSRGL